MPGKSYHDELPPADEGLIARCEGLRRDIAHLAVEIGERNVLGRPKELAMAADWLEAQFEAAGYEVNRLEYQVSGYHQAEDTIDKVDLERMARVVRRLENVVAELVGEGP